ncbi:aldo/keto reductase [Desulfonatronum thiosulfatophilum]|nr:aldo/keto reductase [Desulfonatronum thiosulfatophilum]
MEHVTIPQTKLDVSRVALGTWAIGGWMWGGTDEQESIRTIHAALDKGVNVIDTAPVYGFGRSEEIVGKALKEYGRRENVRIATKAGLNWTADGQVFRDCTPERITKEIDESLQRLGVDHIDIYFVHWPDPTVPIEETAQVMNNLFKQGKIGSIGVSNYSTAQMDAFRGEAPLHLCQPPYNIFEREIEQDILPYCKTNNIALMTYGVLCRGLLSGKMRRDREFKGDDLRKADPKFQQPRYDQYLAAVEELKALGSKKNKGLLPFAVRWVLDRDVEIALWGGRNPDQMEPLAEIEGWKVDSEIMQRVEDILDEHVTDPVGPEFMAPPSRNDVSMD